VRLGLFQFDVASRKPDENLRRIFDGTRDLDADLLVLPELCTSGYLLSERQASEPAIEVSGRELAPFLELARNLDACVVAGVIEKAEDRLYNSAVVVGPTGSIGVQRKLHITRLERPIFQPGEAIETFTFREVTFGVVTCFDAWFPEVARRLTRNGAQLLCQPAAFGGLRTLDVMKVRSLENGVFSITANRIGSEARDDLRVSFCGRSQVVDCTGEIVAKAEAEQQTLVVDADVRRADVKDSPVCQDLSLEWARYYRDPPRTLPVASPKKV
jgi:predicted amidohydrolase